MKRSSAEKLFIVIVVIIFLIDNNNAFAWIKDSSLIKAKYDKAFSLYKKEQWSQAVVLFSGVIHDDASYVKAYLYRGVCYGMMNNSDSAIADYEQVLILDPKNKNAYKVLILRRFELKQYSAVIPLFNKAIELYPSEGYFYYYRGLSYFLTDDYKAALPDLDKCISLGGKHEAEALIMKANIKRNEKKYDEAAFLLERFFTKFPGDKMGYYERGLLHYDQNDYKNALNDFEQAIAQDPGFYVKAFFWTAESKRFMGQHLEALKDYDYYISKGDPATNAKGYLGKMASYIELDKKNEAYQSLSEYENHNGEKNYLITSSKKNCIISMTNMML